MIPSGGIRRAPSCRLSARVISFAILTIACPSSAQEFHADIPKVWDDSALKTFEVPLSRRDRSPRYMASEEYYKLKVRPIYRTYPIYVEGREPAGYLESLTQKEPEVIFDASKLHTKEEWIQAGRLVFDADAVYEPARLTPEQVRKYARGFSKFVTDDGILPAFAGGEYAIRKKGVCSKGIVILRILPHAPDAGRYISQRRTGE